MSNIIKILSIWILCLANFFVQAQEKEPTYEQERFSASLGAFYSALNSSVIVGIDQLGVGLSLELEDALGLDANLLVVRGDATYSFGKKRNKRLSAGYLGLIRKADRTLGREVVVDDVVLPLETKIQTRFNLEIYELSYNWGFFQDERMRIGLGGGLFVMPLGFSIGANNEESDFFQFVAPLPTLELSTEFYLGPRWTYSQSLNLFFLRFGTFEGSLTDLSIKVDYRVMDRWALGAGLNSFKINVKTQDELFLDWDFKGSIQSDYFGAFFYLKYLIKYKD